MAFIAACAVSVLFAGCSDKAADVADKTSDIISKVKGTKKVSLSRSAPEEGEKDPVPEGLTFIADEFEGMDVDITADIVKVDRETGPDIGRSVELSNPEMIAKVGAEKEKLTKITAAEAVITPADKRMDFSINVRVEGPAGQLIETDRLSWHYSQDYIVAEDGFTLEDGSGSMEGTRLKTDTGFRFMDVR